MIYGLFYIGLRRRWGWDWNWKFLLEGFRYDSKKNTYYTMKKKKLNKAQDSPHNKPFRSLHQVSSWNLES